MRVALLVPGPIATVSGGYGYDREIVAGLRGLGHDVEAVELAGRFPLADDMAAQAMRAAWDALAADCVPVIDGLALPACTAGMLDDRAAVGLIHHPTALETGRSEENRETLRAIERDLLPRLARVVATSDATAERLATEFGVMAERIRVVVPGTAAAPRSAGSGGPGCAILAVGTLIPRKGHDVLLQALSRLVDLDWRLTIVGDAARDPAHAGMLTARAAELGIAARVTFAGAADAAHLDALWAETDLFALATWFEGYGMAVAEALKRGIPVAVTSGGAAAALVTPECGVACAPGDADQLSKALRRVIFDQALRRDMADAAWSIGGALPDWRAQARAFADALQLHASATTV